jgi:hypothetical protein
MYIFGVYVPEKRGYCSIKIKLRAPRDRKKVQRLPTPARPVPG